MRLLTGSARHDVTNAPSACQLAAALLPTVRARRSSSSSPNLAQATRLRSKRGACARPVRAAARSGGSWGWPRSASARSARSAEGSPAARRSTAETAAARARPNWSCPPACTKAGRRCGAVPRRQSDGHDSPMQRCQHELSKAEHWVHMHGGFSCSEPQPIGMICNRRAQAQQSLAKLRGDLQQSPLQLAALAALHGRRHIICMSC